MGVSAAQPNYWVNLFAWNTWQTFVEDGGDVSGFREGSRNLVRQMRPGDFLICYVVRLARWIAVVEVTSEPYEDDSPRWQEDVFPCRVKVRMVTQLTAETAVPLFDLEGQLSIFKPGVDRRAVGNYLRRSPTKLSRADGETLVKVLLAAENNPVVRAVDAAKLAWAPRLLKAKEIGTVTVPDDQEAAPVDAAPASAQGSAYYEADPRVSPEVKEATVHTEIQWDLLRLGIDMKLDVWVAKNDRSKSFNGQVFADMPRMKAKLPVQFDEATNRTIELIDVLWLKGNQILAAFEIESTTSIYSGLLRMSDLIAMQPNLTIPLYLVAPNERREKVFTEANRPTFSKLSPSLTQLCRFISFSSVKDNLSQLPPSVTRNLSADYMQEDEVSESLLLDGVESAG